MPYDPFSFFKAGQEIGKSKNAGFTQGTNVVMDAFKNQAERKGKLQDAIELKSAENALPMNAKDQAQTEMYKAKTAELSNPQNGGARGIFLVNRRTGKISKAGDSSMAEVDQTLVGQKDRIMGVDIPPASATSMFSSAEASTKQIDDLMGMLKTNPNVKMAGQLPGMLSGLGDEQSQRYHLIRKDFSDRLLRLRSGAQINEQEFSRLMGMLPQWYRNNGVDIEQLGKFKNEYTNLMGRLSGGGLSTGTAERADTSQDDTNTSNPAFQQNDYKLGEDPAGLFD